MPDDAHHEMRSFAAKFAKLNTDPHRIRRNSVYRAKLRILESVFRVPLSPRRRGQLDKYLAEEGHGLLEFATWCALIEKYGAASPKWRKSLRDPEGAAHLRIKLADRIAFYSWLQWICDEQLATAQQVALDAGMEIGIIHDLAVGVQQGGADAWALGDALDHRRLGGRTAGCLQSARATVESAAVAPLASGRAGVPARIGTCSGRS